MGVRTGKPRGRPKNVRNKRTIAREREMEAAAELIGSVIPNAFEGDGHAFMMAIYKDPRQPVQLRLDAAKAAAGYEKPRLAATELTGKGGGPVQVTIEGRDAGLL